MAKSVTVRLFYTPACSGGCCGCGTDPNLEAFEKIAGELVKKFGEGSLSFEAYSTIDNKKFPFLCQPKSGGGIKTPVLTVGEKIISSGKMPSFSKISEDIAGALK
jgi:hypothetical protein